APASRDVRRARAGCRDRVHRVDARRHPPQSRLQGPARRQARANGCEGGADMSALEVEVDGKPLKLSNLEKVFYPETGFTKGQVIDYYTRVAPVLLPHLDGRPLTLKRYPNGVNGKFFYEKECPRHRPDWVLTSAVWSRHNARTIDFCLAEDLP